MRIIMPITTGYPGVYIEEVSAGARPIEGVPTSTTAFLGPALRGPSGAPGRARSWSEFERLYGGLWSAAPLGYAVRHFFDNGGAEALVVRLLHSGATAARARAGLPLVAASEGSWGNELRARIEVPGPSPKLFDLAVKDLGSGASEVFPQLSVDPADPRYVGSILAQQSQLVRIDSDAALSVPPASAAPAAGADAFADPTATAFAGGGDGGDVTEAQITEGLRLLDQVDLFNLLCIPPLKRSGGDIGRESWDAAIAYAKSRRAFVIVDPPERWTTTADVLDARSGITGVAGAADNAAMYFPRIAAADPLNADQPASFAPCGAIAGIFARIDRDRGFWKAPAGQEAALHGISQLSRVLSDSEDGQLNSAGINALRSFAGVGNVVWGARTLKGADSSASEWKYIPVRRLVFYIQESISRGTRWAVFEPNAEPLWAALRLQVVAFMHGLFSQGALQGQSAQEAYFVKCGHDTTTQAEIDSGIVNVEIGLAPLKPAEFVIIQIQQIASVQT
jgi:Bacteriophage tail sheath protein